MSVVPMKRISVIALRKDRKAVLEYLQVLGAVQISFKRKEDDLFQKVDMSSRKQVFEKNAHDAEEALAILKRNVPEKKPLGAMFTGRTTLSLDEFQDVYGRREQIMHTVRKVIRLDKKQADTVSSIPKLEDQKKSLEPWMNFDLPLDLRETEKTAVFTGTLQGQYTRETLYTQIRQTAKDVEAFDCDIISSDAVQTCIFLVCEKKDREIIREALRRMNFAAPPNSGMNPSERMKQIDAEIQAAEDKLKGYQKEFEQLAAARNDIRFASDYFTARADKYGVISELLQTRRVFCLEGYVPENIADALKGKLEEKFDIAVSIKDPGKKEKVPVLLKNNAFAAPLEGVTESYSLPGKGEIDPTMVAACFYYILFGIMLSDAAYGLLLFLGTTLILLLYGKKMEPGQKKTYRMFQFCGISTTFWGFMFGSFFGDAPAVIGRTFPGRGAESLLV